MSNISAPESMSMAPSSPRLAFLVTMSKISGILEPLPERSMSIKDLKKDWKTNKQTYKDTCLTFRSSARANSLSCLYFLLWCIGKLEPRIILCGSQKTWLQLNEYEYDDYPAVPTSKPYLLLSSFPILTNPSILVSWILRNIYKIEEHLWRIHTVLAHI